ncbi:MAG: PAS domain-containing sensor histidine kinase [Sphingomicrobium sp.]
MASSPADRRPVMGRVDRAGRLIAADPELAELQIEAGSSIGATLALPQIAAIARLARKLGLPVSRPAIAAGADQDIELWVRAIPQGDEVSLTLEGWTPRPAAAPRLASLLGGGDAAAPDPPELNEWEADRDLRILSISPALAKRLGEEPEKLAGQQLTQVFRLEENDDGEMPLVAALAARHGFTDQTARPRSGDSARLILSGDVRSTPDGSFNGFSGRAVAADGGAAAALDAPVRIAIDQALDEALRSPLDRIIDCAEAIAERSDGPLRSDYASYATDISAAARHLLSVIHAMTDDPADDQHIIDLAALAAEAIVLLETLAETHGVVIAFEATRALRARGEDRAVIQILVNLIGNAIRHSPRGETVTLRFSREAGSTAITVSDAGPGIAHADQQRIFERFEQAAPAAGGTGLGLAIARRLARSMRGDIAVVSQPGAGARFTLTLPAA